MSRVAELLKKAKIRSFVLNTTTLLDEMSESQRKHLEGEYKLTQKLEKVVVSLMNAILTNDSAFFIMTRSSLRQLLQSDRNWKHAVKLHDRDYSLMLSVFQTIGMIKREFTGENGVSVWKVTDLELLSLMSEDADYLGLKDSVIKCAKSMKGKKLAPEMAPNVAPDMEHSNSKEDRSIEEVGKEYSSIGVVEKKKEDSSRDGSVDETPEQPHQEFLGKDVGDASSPQEQACVEEISKVEQAKYIPTAVRSSAPKSETRFERINRIAKRAPRESEPVESEDDFAPEVGTDFIPDDARPGEFTESTQSVEKETYSGFDIDGIVYMNTPPPKPKSTQKPSGEFKSSRV